MKLSIIALLIAGVATFGSTIVLAQDNVTPDQPTTEDDGVVTTRTSDWLWLIPVIGIPLLLYALAQSQRGEDRTMTGSDRLAGTKGGEVTRRRNRDDSMMDE